MPVIDVASLSMLPIAKLVEFGRQLLQANSDSAKLDSEILLCFVLEQSRSYLLTWPEKAISTQQIQLFSELLARRYHGEPIAYITQTREFWSLPLQVSPATLIPRPDTEILIELVLAQHSEPALRCLDLGTGTGAIALALASEQPSWSMDAVDFSLDAVKLAQLNAKALGLTQLNIYQSDWFSNICNTKKFDIIVSNPPYIDENDQHLSQGDVRFEPKSALVAAQQGFADINKIADEAIDYFDDVGYLYLEHGFEQGQQVRDILTTLGYCQIKTVQDYANNDRMTLGCFIKNNA